jgi:nitrite reductase/ring-hydroxylating ferredoxin subunit
MPPSAEAPASQTSETPLFKIDDVVDGDSAGFTVELDGVRRRLAVVRKGDQVFVYINRCPHVGAPLDWQPGRFLTRDKDLIQCTAHGALFNIEDGECVFGPCVGRALESVPVTVRDGQVYADPDED